MSERPEAGRICVVRFCFSCLLKILAREIVQRGRHGIQLIPDLIEIFILLFADDVILMSDSVYGLQNQLNILYKTANRLGLVVNMDKSNIVCLLYTSPSPRDISLSRMPSSA